VDDPAPRPDQVLRLKDEGEGEGEDEDEGEDEGVDDVGSRQQDN